MKNRLPRRLWLLAMTLQMMMTVWPMAVYAQTSKGLVAWYKMDEASGTTANDSSTVFGQTANNGTVESGVTVNSAGKIGAGYLFNGSSGYVDVSYTNLNFERTNSFSIAAWVKYTDIPGANWFAIWGRDNGSCDQGMALVLPPSAQGAPFHSSAVMASLISNYCSDNDIQVQTANNTVSGGKWYHIAMTYNGSSLASGLKIYINGVSMATSQPYGDTLSGSVLANVDWRIGDDYTNDWMNGTMDDLRVYNRALTPGEIYEIFQQGNSTHMGTEF